MTDPRTDEIVANLSDRYVRTLPVIAMARQALAELRKNTDNGCKHLAPIADQLEEVLDRVRDIDAKH